jgi:formylglycine-generating enzyme required for sulfatase activity
VTEKGTNSFSYRLTKNTGYLSISVKPVNAQVYLNNELKSSYSKMELSPGFYKIEVKAESHVSSTKTVEVKLGETLTKSITLSPKYGELRFLVNPNTATIEISQKGTVIKTIIGSQIIRDLLEGDYDITANASGFKSYKGKFNIRDQERTEHNIELQKGSDAPANIETQKGSDIPANMVLVDGGTFKRDDYSVTVSSFIIGKYEVTQREWQEVMGNNPSYFKGDNRPVEQVSWYDAVEYCNKLSKKEGLTPAYTINGDYTTCNWSANGYRLPTEAEWEYAARGGNKSKGYTYSGSNTIGNVAWYDVNSDDRTHDVGTKAPNELGIYDMTGNVWEWCWDWYASYSSSSQTNPKGANSGSYRVDRGGSWYYFDFGCRVATRLYNSPGYSYSILGLRVLRTIQ